MDRENIEFHFIVLFGGLLFGAGLSVSNMAQPEVVLSFLQFEDFGLLFVMFGAAVVTGIGFHLLPGTVHNSVLTHEKLGKRLKSFDKRVLFGGAIFGVGWGISGICPGAAYASIGIGNLTILWAILGMFIGAYLQTFLRKTVVFKRVTQ